MERTSEEKILGGLTHLAIFFSWIGLVINVILYVVYRPKSAFVAGHVKQAIGLQVVSLLLSYGIAFLGVGAAGGILSAYWMAGAAWGALGLVVLITFALGILFLVMAVWAAIKGFQGLEHRHWLIGDWIAHIGE